MYSEKLRIVSLCPSATETAFTLGLGSNVVGVSHQCDYPPEVERLPRLTESLLFDEGDSEAIDRKVAANRERWGTIYDVREALLAELKPDLVLTQQVCRVCAFPEDAALEVSGRRLPSCRAISFSADRVTDILESIRRLAAAAGVSSRGEALACEIAETVSSIKKRTAGVERKRSFVMEWIDPVRNAGHWIPELMETAGGLEALANWDGKTQVTWEQVCKFAPEVLLVSPCGFEFSRTYQEIGKAGSRPGWEHLPAVRNKRVFLGNGKVITRYTPRIRQVITAMAQMLQPELFAGSPDPMIIHPLN